MVAIEVKSPAFIEGGPIPQRYTCDGEDISPELNFDKIPPDSASLALIVDDPDAPSGTFDHWLAWNIAPGGSFHEGIALEEEGKNDFGELGYCGPCPPRGSPHRYYFKVYALDTQLSLPEGSDKEQLEAAMEGHIIGKGQLMGTYQRAPLS